jgi:hypothetical protein
MLVEGVQTFFLEAGKQEKTGVPIDATCMELLETELYEISLQ